MFSSVFYSTWTYSNIHILLRRRCALWPLPLGLRTPFVPIIPVMLCCRRFSSVLSYLIFVLLCFRLFSFISQLCMSRKYLGAQTNGRKDGKDCKCLIQLTYHACTDSSCSVFVSHHMLNWLCQFCIEMLYSTDRSLYLSVPETFHLSEHRHHFMLSDSPGALNVLVPFTCHTSSAPTPNFFLTSLKKKASCTIDSSVSLCLAKCILTRLKCMSGLES